MLRLQTICVRLFFEHDNDLALIIDEAIGWEGGSDRGIIDIAIAGLPLFLIILLTHLTYGKCPDLRFGGGFSCGFGR